MYIFNTKTLIFTKHKLKNSYHSTATLPHDANKQSGNPTFNTSVDKTLSHDEQCMVAITSVKIKRD